jgi:hypothetical protein
MTIKDFVLSVKLRGGSLDWDFAEELANHIYDEFGIDVDEETVKGVENINHLIISLFRIIEKGWEEYINEQEQRDDITLDLEYFINYFDSHIDIEGKYGLNWSDSKEEAYDKFREARQEPTPEEVERDLWELYNKL